MKYIATKEGIRILNETKMTEIEVRNEHKQLRELDKGKISLEDIVLNWKIKDLVIAPIGENKTLIFKMGEIVDNYENLPRIKYKNEWQISD